MGKTKKVKRARIRRPPPAPQPHLEATPERLAQAGEQHSSLVLGEIDRAGERALLCRRFTDPPSQPDAGRPHGRPRRAAEGHGRSRMGLMIVSRERA